MKNYDHLRYLLDNPNFQAIFCGQDFNIGTLIRIIFNKSDIYIESIEKKYHVFLNEYYQDNGVELDLSLYSCISDLFFDWKFNGEYLDDDILIDLQTFIVLEMLYSFVNEEFYQMDKMQAVKKMAFFLNSSMECFGLYVDLQSREDERIVMDENSNSNLSDLQKEKIAQQARSENARKAGLKKRSQYEKMGTIRAVNELLDEQQDLLQQRGGKSELCRTILDLIVENKIPAPNTPTQKTVETWINNYIKQKSTS